MDKLKQRIHILEFLGWKDLIKKGDNALRGTAPNGDENRIAPNPLTNLNVIQEAEKRLTIGELSAYLSVLSGVIKCPNWNKMAHLIATAEQRSEAFYRLTSTD